MLAPVCVAFILVAAAGGALAQCDPTITTASGTHAPVGFCAGDLIFSDDFDWFDVYKWQHAITMSGGGNSEFQYFTNNRTNSWVQEGTLHLRASLLADRWGEGFLFGGTLNLDGGSPAELCTDRSNDGCVRTGNNPNILHPAQSALLRTVESFSFRYGRLEVRAKMPAGDWLWPAIWMMPRRNAYGTWPVSGEIDIAESRGNRNLMAGATNVGVEQVASTLHFGPYFRLDGFMDTHFEMQSSPGFDAGFRSYQLEWTDSHLKFAVDGVEMGTVTPPEGGFYELGGFASVDPNFENPWKFASRMAPFDQEFFLIINLAVGGTGGYFWDGFVNPDPKPWVDTSTQAFLDFWNARDAWLATWAQGDTSFQIDHVRIWAI